jgi:hypothetical protein
MFQTKHQSKLVLSHSLFITFVAATLSVGCAKNGSFQSVSSDLSSNTSSSVTTPTPTPTPSTPSTSTGSSTTDTTTSTTYKPEALSWESSSHPERAAWSTAAIQAVTTYFTQLDKAKDVTSFCPNYNSLSKDQRINLWADIFASDAYYECGWDPTEYSVDVGTSNDKDTWSVGLLQLSVVDQQSYGFNFGFNFADLQDPAKNLQLGAAIMAKQITKYGVILIPVGGSGLYWATLHPGGKYDASASIEKMTKKLSFCQ